MISVEDLIGEVWCGDFLDLAPQLPDGCIDMVMTSPPYPQGKKKSEDMGRYRRSGTAEEQREQIGGSNPLWSTRSAAHPGGILSQRDRAGHIHGKPNQKGETGLEVRIAAPDWLDWFLSFTPEIKRLLKPNGNFIVNVDSCCYPTRHRHWGVFSLPERMEAQGWCFVDAPVWVKPNGPPVSAPTRFHHVYEFLYWFANGDRWEASIDGARTTHAQSGVERFSRFGASSRREWRGKWSKDEEQTHARPHPSGARPKDVFSCAVGANRWEQTGGPHFAAMPLKLAKWIISWASKPGDIVLDPFGGAGTTCVAALQLERRPIMCEITAAAAEIARKRIAREAQKLHLPLGIGEDSSND